MAISSTTDECPYCKTTPLTHNDKFPTGEQFTNCNKCGYYYSKTLINEQWDTVSIEKPYGAFKIKTDDMLGTQCGSIMDENEFNEIKHNVENQDDVTHFSVTRFVDGQIVEVVYVDK